MAALHFILVPGHWLGGWAWDRVSPLLAAAGHQVTTVTLPGLQAVQQDRSTISWDDHVEALARLVLSGGHDVVLVAHSGAGKVASGVLDRHPRSVRRVIYVESGPAADGGEGRDLPPEITELPLPSWSELTAAGASLQGLAETDLERLRRQAVPHPAGAIREPARLDNLRRRSVPSTLVTCSFPSAVVVELAASGHPMFAEVASLSDVAYVDLPTGHWPMWSQPVELAQALLQAAAR